MSAGALAKAHYLWLALSYGWRANEPTLSANINR